MTRTTRPSIDAPRAFGHPVFWLSLAVLLTNDHVLKGSGTVPSLLTGKLSDFAGMLVAPAVVAIALPLRHARARAVLASGGVALTFATINLWPAASVALETGWRTLFAGARLWPDPSDLLALCVLPLSYALCLPRSAQRHVRLGVQRAMRTSGALLGALACLASSEVDLDGDDEEPVRSDAPQVENATGEPLLLVISSTEGAGGCELYRDARVNILTPDAFHERRELVLDDGARVRLVVDRDNIRCGAAWLQLPDGDEALLYWRDLEKLDSFVGADDERRRNRRVRIDGEPGRYRVELGDDLERLSLGREAPESDCDSTLVEHDLRWSPPPMRQGWLELADVERSDGCLELFWIPLVGEPNDAGVAGPQRLCVPPWAFPFDPGDRLSLIELPVAEGGQRLRITRYSGDDIELQLELWHEVSDFAGSLVSSAEAIDCFGALTDCGAYARPLELTVRGEEDPLQPGDQATVTVGDPEETRVLIGHARHVAWSASACLDGEARRGPSASWLELRNF